MATDRTHIMRWAPQDWRTGKVRARSVRLGDPMLRLVYAELLFALHEAGGSLPADPDALSDELMLPPEEIARCLPILEDVGRHGRGGIVIVDGMVTNARVTEDLAAELEMRAEQVELGRRGGRARALKMTAEERSEQAQKAADARWGQGSAEHVLTECLPDAKAPQADACRMLDPPAPAPAPMQAEELRVAPAGAPACDPPEPEPAKPPEKPKAPPPAAWAIEAAERLRESVTRRWPKTPVPESLVSWARELERIRGAPEDVSDLVAWYSDPARDRTAYLPECRAGKSFREKYDKVIAARKRSQEPPRAPPADRRPQVPMDYWKSRMEGA